MIMNKPCRIRICGKTLGIALKVPVAVLTVFQVQAYKTLTLPCDWKAKVLALA